jgi:polar amino acid transport system substrate-binding protein
MSAACGHRQDLAPTGTLPAAINLGNPVLAQGTPTTPAGVTVDIARELGARLGVPTELVCFDAARKPFEAMSAGRADICFLAIEPAGSGGRLHRAVRRDRGRVRRRQGLGHHHDG